MTTPFMRFFLVAGLFCALISGSFSSYAAASTSVAKYHYAGGNVLLKDTNSAHLQRIAKLPQSRDFQKTLVTRLSSEAVRIFGAKPDAQKSLEPLLHDFLAHESFAEIFGDRDSSFVFAIKLPKERRAAWQTAIKENFTKVRIQDTGDWLLVTGGTPNSAVERSFSDALKSNKIPSLPLKDGWLQADIDWIRLPKYLPIKLEHYKNCRTEITLANRGGDVRTTIRATYPEKLNWKSTPWQVPTNLVGNPNYLVGFRASQNLSAFMDMPQGVKKLTPNPGTNQLFIWAYPDIPFQIYAAMPVSNGDKALQSVGNEIAKTYNPFLKSRSAGTISWNSNQTSLVWTGLSVTTPHLTITNAHNRQYLFGGLFPLVSFPKGEDSPLWNEVVSKPNLIYYDWEITEPRLGAWMMLSQLLPMLPKTEAGKSDPFLKAAKWLQVVAPGLENTVTEATLTAPNQVQIIRKSPLGLTGRELFQFAYWAASLPADTAQEGKQATNK